MKVLKIIGIIIAVVIAYAGLELIPGLIASCNNKDSLNSDEYHFRIKNIQDLKITPYNKGSHMIYEVSSDSESAILIAVRCDSIDSRLKYNYASALDTLCLKAYYSLSNLTLLKESNSVFSSRIKRDYQIDEKYKIKTITLFARQYVYLFIQVYDTEPKLLNRLYGDFKSSRTFCVKNLIAKWEDQLSGESKGWSFFWGLVAFLTRGLVAVALFYLLFFGLPELLEKKGIKIPSIIIYVVVFFIFTYITLHDYFMDWMMGYGSFISIVLGFLSMFLDD